MVHNMKSSILVLVFCLNLIQLLKAEEDEKKSFAVARYHHFHHYSGILWHVGFGVLAVLAIVKIALGISFVGMVTALLHMFAGIKYLLKNTETKSEPVYYHMPYHHHSHEEIEKNPWEYGHGYDPPYPYRRQDLTGGRSINEKSKNRRKRELMKTLNEDDSVILKRISRSVETSNDNCKKKRICQIHARAKHSFLGTFQLYFIKKDGLAQYWDFVDRPFDECGKVYLCGSNAQSITQKEPMKEIVEPKDHTDHKIIHAGRGFRQYYEDDSDYNYSTEYESEYNYQPEEYISNSNWWWSQ